VYVVYPLGLCTNNSHGVTVEHRPKSGKGFVLFDSIKSARAAKEALNGTRTFMGQKITLEFAKNVLNEVSVDEDASAIDNPKPSHKPNERLYFRGCTGEESEIRTVFQEFNASIKDIYLCMLFTLSDSVTTTHMV
jgi:Ca2+-binding EF-hand superfamily protein